MSNECKSLVMALLGAGATKLSIFARLDSQGRLSLHKHLQGVSRVASSTSMMGMSSFTA
jgi:hypothetical protein